MDLDLRQLECFIAVAEEQHFGRAAARLYMTQPPLTRRIARLERDLGAHLFLRTSQGTKITPAGEALLREARRIVAMTQRAIEVTQLAEAGQVGQLVVGYFGSTVLDVVPRLLADFREAVPGIDFKLERYPKNEQADALIDGRIHVGFGRNYPETDGVVCRKIIDEPIFVAMPSNHELADASSVRLADIADEPHVLFPRDRPSFADQVMQMFTSAKLSIQPRAEAEDVVGALFYVASGRGVAVVPRSATAVAMATLVFVPVEDAPYEDISCIYRVADPPPVLRVFLEFLDGWSPPV